MNATELDIPEVILLESPIVGDERGFFLESYHKRDFEAATGQSASFVQDNHSRSRRGVLRGLHYQLPRPQAKLVRVVIGTVWDVAVDLRQNSPTFGRHVGVELSETNHRQLWIPPGFAHGFVVLSDSADLVYKATEFYEPENDRAIHWNDPDLAIDWPIDTDPLLSKKDLQAPHLADAILYD